jgi:hypothetical protein
MCGKNIEIKFSVFGDNRKIIFWYQIDKRGVYYEKNLCNCCGIIGFGVCFSFSRLSRMVPGHSFLNRH